MRVFRAYPEFVKHPLHPRNTRVMSKSFTIEAHF
jgi:hypothetical protein